MTRDSATRTVPITRLRQRYLRLGKRGVSTGKRHEECEQLAGEVAPLLEEFLEAVHLMKSYGNRKEDFYPRGTRVSKRRKQGTVGVTDLLERGPVAVPELAPYVFQYLHREVNPLRTTHAGMVRGARAPWSGAGGLDYVGLLQGEPLTPILGEIKVGSDKDAYYAFVQLLTYLSELSSKAQFTRANRFLFRKRLVYPVRFDLHILLWDYNDRGQRGPVIDSTCRLAAAFKARLAAAVGASCTLRRVLCLRNPSGSFAGALNLVWSV